VLNNIRGVRKTCGSEPAREGEVSVNIDFG